MSNSYLHIRCQDFAILLVTDRIIEIIKLGENNNGSAILWREEFISCYNLSHILLPDQSQLINNNALIIKNEFDEYVGIAVESVSSIEAIEEQLFQKIPSLNLQLKQYFDKVYIHPVHKQCIYRLKIDSFD